MTSYLYRFPNILDLLASQTIHLKIWVASLTPQWKLNPSWVNAKLANSAARRQQHKTFSLFFSRAAPLFIPRSYQTNTIVAIIPTNAFFWPVRQINDSQCLTCKDINSLILKNLSFQWHCSFLCLILVDVTVLFEWPYTDCTCLACCRSPFFLFAGPEKGAINQCGLHVTFRQEIVCSAGNHSSLTV